MDEKVITVNGNKIEWKLDGTKFAAEYGGEKYTASSFGQLRLLLKAKVRKVAKEAEKLKPMPFTLRLDIHSDYPYKVLDAFMTRVVGPKSRWGDVITTVLDVNGKLIKATDIRTATVYRRMDAKTLARWRGLADKVRKAEKALEDFEKSYVIAGRPGKYEMLTAFTKFQSS